MGVDWTRVRFREDADRAALRGLIQREATAFQSFYVRHSPFAPDPVRESLDSHLHLDAWGEARHRIRALVEFPAEGNPSGDPAPELARGMRVAVVGQHVAFPPLWRLRAYRTFLPEQIRPQLVEWQEWLKAIAWGGHEMYLRELWVMANARPVREHWSELRAAALAAEVSEAKWAKEAGRAELIERILRLPEPVIPRFRVEPSEAVDAGIEGACAALMDLARALVDLTKEWNYGLRSKLRVGYHRGHYQFDFEAFRAGAEYPWLDEFFAWADACAARGFGLMLDP